MPARVHALLVVRPEGRVAADIHLRRTLDALNAQSRPVDALTIVLCGDDAAIRQLAADSGAEGVIATDRRTSFAEALRLASHRIDGDAIWVLGHDTIPAPDALLRLAGALETSPSVTLAAPKLVRADDNDRIVSLGVSMTKWGRTVGLADGEHDQGQHDGGDDVLGVDARGILVRADAWRLLGGFDTALAGADEGLDLGIRARLRGGRVVLAPHAIVAIARGDASMAGRAYAQRTAQLHRRLVYAPAPAVALHWLSLLPLALLRSLGALLAKQPAAIGPEWAAALTVMLRPGSIAASRRRIHDQRAASWLQIAPLRVTATQLRQRLDDDVVDGPGRGELRFFGGGGAWVVLGMLLVSILAFLPLLTWPVLGGGGLAPLRATVAQLWADAAYGARPLGWATVGPADPFSAVIAVLGTLSPAAPSLVLVVLWVLAMPLAALGGWFAATRFTQRAVVRALVAVGFALAPSLLDALTTGRPAAVIAHLLLPWLLWTATVAHRSWSTAAMASIIAAAVVACAPSLAPALVALWIVALILTAALMHGRGMTRVVWLIVPTAVMTAPLVWRRLADGDPWALLADPGVPLAGDGGSDAARRLLFALGFPSESGNGWSAILGDGIGGWAVLLIVPLLVLALAAPIVGRTVPAALSLLTATLGLATACAAIGIIVTSDAATGIALWPGPALSLYWLALLVAAAVTIDVLPARRGTRSAVAVGLMVVLAVSAVPALTAQARGVSALTDGPSSTLPAYVAADSRGGVDTATFVVTPASDGAVITDLVWGETSSLGGQTTLRSARDAIDDADQETARIAAELIADPSGDVVEQLAAHGVAFVLLAASPGGDTDAARAVRLEAETSLDQRDDLEIVGDTGRGKLWRVSLDVADRAVSDADAALAGRLAALQIGVIVVALLLAVPTRQSLASARRRSRVVGRRPGGDR